MAPSPHMSDSATYSDPLEGMLRFVPQRASAVDSSAPVGRFLGTRFVSDTHVHLFYAPLAALNATGGTSRPLQNGGEPERTGLITTLGPESSRPVLRPIPVVVERQDDGSLMASFFEASISTVGETALHGTRLKT